MGYALLDRLSYILATVGGAGYLRPAPGTWGSVAGVILWILYPKLWIIPVLFLLGWYASFRILQGTAPADRDPSFIVIDEVVGIMIAYALMGALTWVTIILGFALFRLFDILKPFPIGWIDHKLSLRGDSLASLGIMIDDVLAGMASGGLGLVMLKLF